MADLSITSFNVININAKTVTGISGDPSITAGKALYKREADGLYYRCDADNVDTEKHRLDGIALNGGGVGQPIEVALPAKGTINVGNILNQGKWYVLGTNPGAIRPIDDVVAGDMATLVGFANSGSILELATKIPGSVAVSAVT